jgi:hypothetical protein
MGVVCSGGLGGRGDRLQICIAYGVARGCRIVVLP